MATPQPTQTGDNEGMEPLSQEELLKCLDKPLTSREFTVVQGVLHRTYNNKTVFTVYFLQKLASQHSSLLGTCSRWEYCVMLLIYSP